MLLVIYALVGLGVFIGTEDQDISRWGRLVAALLWPIGIGYHLANV